MTTDRRSLPRQGWRLGTSESISSKIPLDQLQAGEVDCNRERRVLSLRLGAGPPADCCGSICTVVTGGPTVGVMSLTGNKGPLGPRYQSLGLLQPVMIGYRPPLPVQPSGTSAAARILVDSGSVRNTSARISDVEEHGTRCILQANQRRLRFGALGRKAGSH